MSGRKVITERHVTEARNSGNSTITAPAGALVTPLAKDAAKTAGITIVFGESSSSSSSPADAPAPVSNVICIGSDHGGFDLKKELKAHIQKTGANVIDVGVDAPRSCDYPDYAYAVSRMVADGTAGIGIMIDGVGVGSAMVCNKVPGIRAACAYNEFAAWNARAHNNANVLTLGSRSMGPEVVKRIVDVFLETEFEGGRHARRVNKIGDLENRFSR